MGGRGPHLCLGASWTRREDKLAKSRSACVHQENFARSRWPSGTARLLSAAASNQTVDIPTYVVRIRDDLTQPPSFSGPASSSRFCAVLESGGGISDQTHNFSTFISFCGSRSRSVCC